ncbi:MAG: 4Fe-4S dicluster domain-containing protein [Spirochaetes bacterium]|nr:4Fe-4S dicluster domain-containing protein [Spirochaetota bacterium]
MDNQIRIHPAHIALAKKFSSPLYLGPPFDERLISLIKHLFTEKEAEVAINLVLFWPRSAKKLAKKSNKTLSETQLLLNSMHQKRIIFKSKKGYFLAPLIPGMFEYILMGGENTLWHQEYGRLITELFATGYVAKYIHRSLPAIRTVPVQKAIESKTIVSDASFILEMLESHTHFGIINVCQCRQSLHFSGKKCKRALPQDGCLVFGNWAKGIAKRGNGREISREEMRNVIEERWKKNLVFMTANVRSDSPNVICTCCECCCHYLEAVNRFNANKTLSRPPFIASVNEELCTHCGRCVKACNTHAHALVEKKHSFNSGKCIGCGLCVIACTANAIAMIKNDQFDKPSKSFTRLIARISPAGLYSLLKTK